MTTVFVTGASTGIGLATVQELAKKEGYRIYAASRDPESCRELLELAKNCQNVFLQKMDVTSDKSVRDAVDAIEKTEGKIDVLVNNAGRGIFGPVESVSIEQAKEIFDVNVMGVMRVDQAALPLMRSLKRGRIIYISSIVGPMPSRILPIYAASKAAMESLAMTQAKDVSKWNISVSIVQPGCTQTRFFENLMIGDRFAKGSNPYEEQMEESHTNYNKAIETGQSKEEVAAVIVSVIEAKEPQLWVQTSTQVSDAISRHYRDITGSTFK